MWRDVLRWVDRWFMKFCYCCWILCCLLLLLFLFHLRFAPTVFW